MYIISLPFPLLPPPSPSSPSPGAIVIARPDRKSFGSRSPRDAGAASKSLHRSTRLISVDG